MTGSPARAHNPDTSYARIGIGAQRVTCRLTYDLFTLQRIALLDLDRDGRITRAELERGLPALHAFLRRHVVLGVDGGAADLGAAAGYVWPPEAGEAIAERDYHTAEGLVHFDFHRAVDETPGSVWIEFQWLPPLSERHTVLGAFLQAGAPHEVTFTRFEPDYEFVTGYEPPLRRRLGQFLRLGVAHIFLGYDHLCFLVALLLVSRFGELVRIITSFTVAHSITLILATLGVVELPARLVEVGIAATIVYVAVENLRGSPSPHRWRLTFAFGLVHGFGFANVLGGMELPATGLVRCLVAFNLGVEVGQIAIVVAALPLIHLLRRWRHQRAAVVACSALLGLCGAGWFVDRAFGLGWIPF
ncbi:MAG: HupE/UreJ family protein [Opitutaceae bacterium]